MKELWTKNRDTILLIFLVAGISGALFEGGQFLMTILKWPLIVALFVGVAFAIGNDGYHSLKRTLRDKVWPWLKTKLPWLL